MRFIDNLNDKSLIADIGCGSGGQTMVLAQHAPGRITGIGIFPAFIDLFSKKMIFGILFCDVLWRNIFAFFFLLFSGF